MTLSNMNMYGTVIFSEYKFVSCFLKMRKLLLYIIVFNNANTMYMYAGLCHFVYDENK